MADRVIQRACERFRNEIPLRDQKRIESTTSLDEVRVAIQQVERQLAARQSLRNLQRLTPFVDAVHRYSAAVEVACNGTPYLPWLWAPLKFVLEAVYDCTHALDKILMAYASIGSYMPRFARYAGVFPQNHDFQQLLAFLFEDIIEFHRRAYSMIRKPGWQMCFASLWGRFDHRFGSLLTNISQSSELIDREATSLSIMQTAELRQKTLEDCARWESQWQTEQLQSVLNWLGTGDNDPDAKFDWLMDRCHEGTSQWIIKSSKLRTWLQRDRGGNLLWLYGKPGSGKSVLSAQIISFLRADPSRSVIFFFCDFHTPSASVSTHVLAQLCSQLIRLSPDAAPFIYDEYLTKGRKASSRILREALPKLLASFEDIRLVVDGIDEIPRVEHNGLIKDLIYLTNSSPSCKTLLVSQDIPTIALSLSRRPKLCISQEKESIQKDLMMIVDSSLQEINLMHNGVIEEAVLEGLKAKIVRGRMHK
ncbi:hypothetical protein GGR56DRAFT_641517 [Xylariaceae sp. FL0804]|nr:hypothetical protein GGR56DRAFT_641517 [Xylariaceae sp. FL0804]